MKTDNYLKEYSKNNGEKDILRTIKYLNALLKICKRNKTIDSETKENIIDMYETVRDIVSSELSKELKKQKIEGKEFLSVDEIDELVDNIIKIEYEKR